jgi:hypothetical protein
MSIRWCVSRIAFFPASLYKPYEFAYDQNCNSAALPARYGLKRKAKNPGM